MRDNTTNKYLQTIRTMLEEDKHRWDCPDYCGVVVVHPDLVEYVVEMIKANFDNYVVSLKVQRKQFTLKSGGSLTITHMESVVYGTTRRAWHNHVGMEYTSVMFSHTWWGGDELRTVKYPLGECRTNCITYMMSQLRSRSKYVSKFVMM